MFLVCLLLVVASFMAYVRLVTFTHWSRYGIPALVPSLPFGNLADTMTRKRSFGQNINDMYGKSKEALIGIYLLWRPAILLREPELIRQVLGQDFSYFHDRGVYTRPEADPVSDNIFAMTGLRWKRMRFRMTPIFTAGRVKTMLPKVFEKADNLVAAISEKAAAGKTIEIKDYSSRFALDTIASILFGLEVDTIKHRKHSFRIIERQSQNRHYIFNLVLVLIFLCPGFLEFIRLPSLPPQVKKYAKKLVTFQIEQREQQNIVRKDFIQCLIQIRNSGKLSKDENDWKVRTVTEDKKTMSIEQCVAQVHAMYIAGFDSTASTIAFTIFEVARNPRVKALLQADIDRTLEEHNGELTYERINEMQYLELCVLETLRKYPVLPLLNRLCTKEYSVPNTDTVIPEGTAIVIPLLAIARDPNNFPDPMQYRPERFSDNPPNFNEAAFMPFGDGPRKCIGIRLGKLMTKIGIVKQLQKFDFEVTNDNELEFDNYGMTLLVKGGIPLRITNR